MVGYTVCIRILYGWSLTANYPHFLDPLLISVLILFPLRFILFPTSSISTENFPRSYGVAHELLLNAIAGHPVTLTSCLNLAPDQFCHFKGGWRT